MSAQYFPPKHGVVSFLDILGTKSMWQENKAQLFLTNIKKLYDDLDDLATFENKLPMLKDTFYAVGDTKSAPFKKHLSIPNLKLEVSTFSDIIIIAFYQDSVLQPLSDSLLIYLVGYMLIPVFRRAFENEIFLRGVISIGKFFISKGTNGVLLVSPAVNDAAQSYNNTNWVGISTSQNASLTLEQEHSLNDILEPSKTVTASHNNFRINLRRGIDLISSSLINYNIPNKSGIEKRGWALAWPSFHDNGTQYRTQETMDKTFDKLLSYQTYQENSVDFDVYIKFKNTKFFYDACCATKQIDCNSLSENNGK